MFEKKATTETMSFLIGIIIFIMLIVPIAIATVHACQSQSNTEKTLKLLVERTEKLKDGENGSIIGQLPDDAILLGFEKERKFGSGWWACGAGWQTEGWFSPVEKPKQCGKEACLCVCTSRLFAAGFCEDAVCKNYSSSFNPRLYGGTECEYGPYIYRKEEVIEISYQRAGENYGICTIPPCLSKEIDDARKSFESFVADYEACKKMDGEDCICSERIVKFPHGFRIMANTDGERTVFALRDHDGINRGLRQFDKDTLMYYSTEKKKIMPVADIEFGRGLDDRIECAGEACAVIDIPVFDLGVYLYKTPYGASFVKEGEWQAFKAGAKMCSEGAGARATAETHAELPAESPKEALPAGWESS